MANWSRPDSMRLAPEPSQSQCGKLYGQMERKGTANKHEVRMRDDRGFPTGFTVDYREYTMREMMRWDSRESKLVIFWQAEIGGGACHLVGELDSLMRQLDVREGGGKPNV